MDRKRSERRFNCFRLGLGANKTTAGKPTKDFAQPAGVVVQRIDKASGLLAAQGQETGTLDEVFLDGTAPTQQAASAGQETNPDKLLLQ